LPHILEEIVDGILDLVERMLWEKPFVRIGDGRLQR
jgi:hypothetical protein